MRWQTTAVLAVLLALVGGFYYVWEVRWAPGREEAESHKGRIFSAETKDVTEIEIKRPDSTVRFTRQGDGWQMVEPVKTRADGSAVDGTVTSVITAKADREIAANPTALADFGLDRPAAVVTLKLKDGKSLGLELGARSPTGVWVYARQQGRPAVVAISDSVLRDATKPVADLRDRTVLAFDRANVTGFEIVTTDATIDGESTDGTWRLTHPVALRADTDTVTDFLDKLATAKVKEFVAEDPRARESYGLDRPMRVTVQTGKDKERASHTLLLGRFDAAKKGVYAMRPGEGSVLLLPEEVWKAVPRNVAVLRDKVLVEFERDKITRIDIDSAKGPVSAAREGDRWKIVAPEALPADQVEVGAVLFKLAGLRAQGFLSDDASAIPRFLAKPAVRVTLTQQGAAPLTVLLAPSRDRRGGQPSAYAAIAGRGPVALVEGKAMDDLARSVTDLRDHTVLAGLDPKTVKRLRVREGAQSVVLERKGDSDWRLVEPTKGAASSTKVDDLVYAVRGLKWKEIVAPQGQDAARYGLDAPSLEVTLLRADGSEIGTVLVGKREGDRAYVKTRAAAPIYAIDGRALPAPKLPDGFK